LGLLALLHLEQRLVAAQRNQNTFRAAIPAGIAGLIAAVPFAALNDWIDGPLGTFFGYLGLAAFVLVGGALFVFIGETTVFFCPHCGKRVKMGYNGLPPLPAAGGVRKSRLGWGDARWAGALAALALAGCGAPGSVSAQDLERDGAFWNELSPPLKSELAATCRERESTRRAAEYGEGDPGGITETMKALPVEGYVAKLNTLYGAPTRQGMRIAAACTEVTQELLGERFNELTSP